MRSAHGAGFLFGLSELGITHPDIIIGTSGNAGNVLYYVTGQKYSARKVWGHLLSNRKFISYLRLWRIIDVDYLIDTVFKKQEPLDVDALMKSGIDWYVPATDIETGKARYFGKLDLLDIFELLRAAKAIPIFYGRRLPLFGKTYFDGEFGPTIADHVSYALGLGAKNILIINNNAPKGKLNRLETHLYAALQSTHLRDAIVRDVDEGTTCITANGATIVCVSPDLQLGILTRNRKKLIKAYDTGVDGALAMEQELRTLFNTPSHTQEVA